MNLGFSISCFGGDIPLLRGCLESIRYFAPDAPISLVVDGDLLLKKLQKQYNLIICSRRDVRNKHLKSMSFGYGFTKMVALWEAPFDCLIHVDTDVLLWGDIRQNLPPPPWDFIFNEPHQIITTEIQKSQYFDPDIIFDYIPPFPWKGNNYFNSGVFACRVGALDLDEYIRMLEIHRKTPGVFPLVDQTMLNIMVFRALHSKTISAVPAHLQTPVPVTRRDELERKFQILDGKPVVKGDATSIHWAGTKPFLSAESLFREPMDMFRHQSLRKSGWPQVLPRNWVLRADEWISHQHTRFQQVTFRRICAAFRNRFW